VCCRHCAFICDMSDSYMTHLIRVSLQCIAVCCSVLQCVAVYCSVLQCVAGIVHSYVFAVCIAVCCRVLQCDAVCCSVLQCVAVCCCVLQYVADIVHSHLIRRIHMWHDSCIFDTTHTFVRHATFLSAPYIHMRHAIFIYMTESCMTDTSASVTIPNHM